MDERLYLINLYDYYGDLLTQKQKDYFEEYYFNNLTLLEISENYEVSRNAVHKQLKEVEEKLKHYEQCLEIYKKRNKKSTRRIATNNKRKRDQKEPTPMVPRKEVKKHKRIEELTKLISEKEIKEEILELL